MTITYHFKLPEGGEKIFPIELNPESIELSTELPEILPDWSELDYHKCSHCPLQSDIVPHCPLAASLVPVVTHFQKILSYETLFLDVITPERRVSQETTAQRALSSFMGLIIATCGCPHTAYFKPMARFHLPLASEAETVYRSTSMYLLAQYFLSREQQNYDITLKGLDRIYKNMQVVNSSLVDRLRKASTADSSVNAIIMLDMYAKTIPYVIEDSLEEIRYLFASYLQ